MYSLTILCNVLSQLNSVRASCSQGELIQPIQYSHHLRHILSLQVILPHNAHQPIWYQGQTHLGHLMCLGWGKVLSGLIAWAIIHISDIAVFMWIPYYGGIRCYFWNMKDWFISWYTLIVTECILQTFTMLNRVYHLHAFMVLGMWSLQRLAYVFVLGTWTMETRPVSMIWAKAIVMKALCLLFLSCHC